MMSVSALFLDNRKGKKLTIIVCEEGIKRKRIKENQGFFSKK